jgi:hypothetical protein
MAVEAVIFQQIVDINWDQAIYTASPNNSINVAQFAAKGSGTNIGIALTPKGTGYISAQVPDGTATGGNARGANSVDLQTRRSQAASVASGIGSGILCGIGSQAIGENAGVLCGSGNGANGIRSSVISGSASVSTGTNACVGGLSSLASGENALAFGSSAQATAANSAAIGSVTLTDGEGGFASGIFSRAHRRGMRAHAGTGFATNGDAQSFLHTLAGKTTTNAAVELFLSSAGTGRIVLLTNTAVHAKVTILGSKSDGSAVAKYMRQVSIKRVTNTTSLVGSVEIIGVDEAAGTSIDITADDTNESLKITATGIASETWRWIAVVEGAELGIGA